MVAVLASTSEKRGATKSEPLARDGGPRFAAVQGAKLYGAAT
jgi:hypothetical protein